MRLFLCYYMCMYIARANWTNKCGKTYQSLWLRENYREDGKVKTRNIANLKDWPPELVAALDEALAANRTGRGKKKKDAEGLYRIQDMILESGRSYGAAFVVLEMAKQLGIQTMLGTDHEGKLALWQVVARVLEQGSRLSAVRLAHLHELSALLDLEKGFTENDLYDNLAWIAGRQNAMESALFAARYPDGKTPRLFLYDVTSSYLEGKENELAAYGYNRDKKQGKKQIVIGLLCDDGGIPVSVEVFEGNTSDPKTVTSQIQKVAKRFCCERVTFVGDRGMLKSNALEELAAEDFSYITGITRPQVEKLLREESLQLGLFDSDLKEVQVDAVRYIYRRNPVRQEEIAAVRRGKVSRIDALATRMNTYLAAHPKAKPETAQRRVTEAIERLGLSAWLHVRAIERTLVLEQDVETLTRESRLDGCYVLKTDLPADVANKETIHARYKSLSHVERAFRNCKSVLELRPLYVRKKESTRGHVFITMLAYMIRQKLETAWGNMDMTVEEGLEHLKRLCVLKMKLPGGIEVSRLPQPDTCCASLLKALDVTLPSSIPQNSACVRTYKKLKQEA